MINKIFSLAAILLVLFGCSDEPELTFSSESFTQKKLDMCQNVSCPEVTINYIKASGIEDVAATINSKIEEYIIASLQIAQDEEITATSIEEAAAQFIETYRMHSAEFPDIDVEYTAKINITKLFTSEYLVSLEAKQYKYTGGAHGYAHTSYKNIDPQTGAYLTNKELFQDVERFKAFAEREFREKYEIPPGDNINSTGFWFEGETFSLPESIGFTNDQLILLYNQYDIASYAEGPVEVRISRAAAAPYLNIK